MLATWPDKYDKYVSSGMYEDESGHTVGADGLHISADAPEKVKTFFREKMPHTNPSDGSSPLLSTEQNGQEG